MANAAVLSEVFPEKRAQLFERARYFAWGRIIGGVHFPIIWSIIGAALFVTGFLNPNDADDLVHHGAR